MVISAKGNNHSLYFTQQYSRTFKLARFPQIFFYFFILLKIGKKQKGDKSLKNKTCLHNILYFTISFLTLPSLYFTMFTPLVGAVNRCPCDEKRDTSLTSDDTIVLSIPVSSDTVTMHVPT